MKSTTIYLSVVCWLFLCAVTHSQAAERPNVLMIAVDDLNDWVGCLGGYGGTVHTPHIDRLAQRGMLFSNAHCPAPVCNPSRTAIMTGLRPSTSGVYNNGHWWRPALPETLTISQWFLKSGYHVEGGGKIFHHTPGFNPPSSWSRYFPQVFDSPWHRPKQGDTLPVKKVNWPPGFPLNKLENVRLAKRPPANPKEFDWGPFDKTDAEMGDGQMVAWAKSFLETKHDKPFFLATGIFRPHLPWYAPRKYFEMYPLKEIVLPEVPQDDLDDIPPAGRKMAEYRGNEWTYVKQQKSWKRAVQAYLASITFADALVGELLTSLDNSEYSDNTIVVLWSDHGWHLGEKHHWHKFTLWEEATRVPLVVVAPGVTQPGTHSSEPVGLIDLYPTLLDLCGLDINQRLDGESLVGLLKDPNAQRDHPALTTHGRGNHSLRSKRYRYIHYEDGSEELYDHQSDPHEWTNLASRAEFKEIKQQLQKWLPKTNVPPAPGKSAYRFDPLKYEWSKYKK